jgi:hypothetical protein
VSTSFVSTSAPNIVAVEKSFVMPSPLDVTNQPFLDLYVRMYVACLKSKFLVPVNISNAIFVV